MISDEQLQIINAVKEGFNVQVDAVAGSGKTTTILSLADAMPDKTIIQLTYNRELMEEVKQKKAQLSDTMYLDNLSIYTYHSLAFQFYSTEAKNDIGISNILINNMKPRRTLPNIDILVGDEVQDMNFLYYQFIRKFIRDLNKQIQLVFLGDKYQGLYQFKGADTRFLTFAHKIWEQSSPFPFKILTLSTSYRVTTQIADFVNNVMLNEPRIKAVKNGENVNYIRHPSAFESYKIIGRRLLNMLSAKLIKPQDIFILAPSVKSEKSAVKKLENMLVRNNIPCYVPMSETSSIESVIIQNKVIFSSFHQSKGRERKIVVVYGFDNSYFNYFDKDAPPNICPSTFYVAATRAKEHLYIMESDDPLDFLNYSHADMVNSDFIDFEGIPLVIKSSKVVKETQTRSSPTDLIKFLDENTLLELSKLVEPLFTTDNLSFPLNDVKITSVVKSNYHDDLLSEEVFDINGLAIPSLYEEYFSKHNTIKTFVRNYLDKNPNDSFYAYKLKYVDFENTSISDHLKIVNIYISMQEHLHFKVAQIKSYDWLDEKCIHRLFQNIQRHIKTPLEYEREIIGYKDDKYKNIDALLDSHFPNFKLRLNARIDALTDTIVWEFKCVDAIDLEHLLQLIIYAWIWKMTCEAEFGPRIFKIMNIRTAEVQTLTYTNIDPIIILILKSKYSKKVILSDENFINFLK